MALVSCGSLTSMVNFFMVPPFKRLEILRRTAASESPTFLDISTKESCELPRRSTRICSSTLSSRLHLFGGYDLVQNLEDPPDLVLRHHQRWKQPDDRPS